MDDNTKIAINSIVIFARLIITSLIGIYTSRIVLDALGVSDYGLYNVVGGIVSLLNLVNTAMLSTTYRFIAVELGKKEDGEPQKVFNACFFVHVLFSVCILIIGIIIGDWYISNYLNVPDGKISDAIFVFHVSLFTTAISTLLVPYQGMLVAFEKFSVSAIIDIVTVLFRLGIIIVFIYLDGNRLRLYSIINFSYTVVSSLLYLLYCFKEYFSIVKFTICKNIHLYKEMLSFALWTLLGAVAIIGKTNGTALIVNFFFGTIVNAAFAVATQVENFILMFARSLSNAAIPQITKNFSVGHSSRSIKLTSYISKYTFILMSLVAFPVMLEMDFLLSIWLMEVPANTALFCRLIVLGALISSLGEGIPALVNATGNIRTYQIIFHTFNLLGLPISFVLYKCGMPARTILIVYCCIYLLSAVLRMILLKFIYNFDIRIFIRVSYLRIAYISLPLLIFYSVYRTFEFNTWWSHVLGCIAAEFFLLLSLLIFGFDKEERKLFVGYLKPIINILKFSNESSLDYQSPDSKT